MLWKKIVEIKKLKIRTEGRFWAASDLSSYPGTVKRKHLERSRQFRALGPMGVSFDKKKLIIHNEAQVCGFKIVPIKILSLSCGETNIFRPL